MRSSLTTPLATIPTVECVLSKLSIVSPGMNFFLYPSRQWYIISRSSCVIFLKSSISGFSSFMLFTSYFLRAWRGAVHPHHCVFYIFALHIIIYYTIICCCICNGFARAPGARMSKTQKGCPSCFYTGNDSPFHIKFLL